MHYDEIVQLQEQHASWALLRSPHAALMLSFFGRVFVESNSGGRPAPELVSLLDDELYALNQRLGPTPFGAPRRPIWTLGDLDALPGGLSEVTVRTSELTRLDPPVGQVIIVENDVSYLALPDRPGTMAIFGAGFALGSVAGLSWLSSKTITYWGDIDTYGFVILNRLRARYPRVVSILMDAETLLAHPDQWVVEERPTEIACRI